ncbi:MAG: hypothetical protein M1480_07205 [Bacteroidetes bacterium]|nr:hypothetical protein [Bacteroidota bacterium]
MKPAKFIFTLLITTIIFLFSSLSFSQEKIINKCISISKISANPTYTRLNINNISTFVYNNGYIDNNPDGSLEGMVFPKGSGKTCIYQSGFLWGGKINGQIQVGGSAYRTGLTPGKILQDGSAEDPNQTNVRIYRVRRDFRTSDLKSEINDGEGTYQQIFVQYEKDWNEWPAKMVPHLLIQTAMVHIIRQLIFPDLMMPIKQFGM